MSEKQKMELDGEVAELAVLQQITGLINSPDFEDDGPLGAKPAVPVASADIHTHLKQVEKVAVESSEAFKKAMARTVVFAGPVAQVAAGPVTRPSMPLRIFTTGRLKSGKDHFLTALGYSIRGFAEPLYALQKQFFGTADKSTPGARQFLQTVGQWGRGVLNDRYPITAGRAIFTTMIRTMGKGGLLPQEFAVDWSKYGVDPALWLTACLRRIDKEGGPASPLRIAISNVRFANEFETLRDVGWKGYHVMCSPETWAKRLKESGLSPTSPQVTDTSEELAIYLDKDAFNQVKKKPMGPKMRVVWNDPLVKTPSNRFYTVDELRNQ